MDELINIPIKAEERFVIQLSFKRHNPRQKLQLMHDPLCFQNPRNPPNLPHKSTIRANPSIRKPIHPPPPLSVDVGVSSLPSSFETSSCFTLSTGANFRSPRCTAVLYMFSGRVPALYLVVSCPTHLIRFRHYGRNRRNRG